MGYPEFDLLGDPIPEGFGKRGRPPHVRTDEKARLVIQLLAFDRSVEYIASALAITPPTLRKHYFRELRQKAEARARVEGRLLSSLMAEVDKGNATAIARYFARLDKHDMAQLAERVADRGGAERPQKFGKKEQQRSAAGAVSGIYAPPPAPGQDRLVN